jgi:hypothetical protein
VTDRFIPLEEAPVIYARPEGWHYHLDRDCTMLQGSQFKRHAYREVPAAIVRRRSLVPCGCAYRKEEKAVVADPHA